MKGDTVVLADGVYDYSRNTLSASDIVVFQSKENFQPRNFEGKLKSIDGTSAPTILVVTIAGEDYTVMISSSTKVLKKNRSLVKLARFVVGDTVRFYGAIKENDKILYDKLIVPAEVVRNTSL